MRSFHIDLSHVQDTTGIHVKFGSHVFELQQHTDETIAVAQKNNHALAALPPGAHQRFTHFVEISEELLPTTSYQWLRVVSPHADPEIFLPNLHLMEVYIPESHRQAHYQKKLKETPTYRHPILAFYGLTTSENCQDNLKACLDTVYLVTAIGTATQLVAYHPDLASTQSYTKQIVSDHILPDPAKDPDQYNRMKLLTAAITDPSNQPWAPVVPCKDKNDNIMTSSIDVADGTKIYIKAGNPVYTQTLTDSTSAACKAPTAYAKRSASNDLSLQNQIWSVKHGTAASYSQQNQGVAKLTQTQSLTDTTSYNWIVNELTPHHGLFVDSGSIQVDDSGNFSIDASNTFLRSLFAYYQLFDDAGNPLSADPKVIELVTATDSIMGIPVSSGPTTLTFDAQGASTIKLLFGGFGTSDWDGTISTSGALMTGVFQYGIPLFLMVGGAAITNSKSFNKLAEDKPLVAATLQAAYSTVGGGVLSTSITNFEEMMAIFGDTIAGMLVSKGLEKLSEWVLEKLAASQFADACGPVGMAFKVASALLDGEEMIVTTGEILSSPATIRVNISRSIGVTLTLTPDPKHGEAGKKETAVWPALAQTYKVILEYQDGGTALVISGDMSPTTNNTPIPLTFDKVLAGSKSNFRITASLCSSTGWVCGIWQSAWMPAVPNNGSTLELGEQSITEILVPLTLDTQYQIKQKIVYENNDYVWQVTDTPPTKTITNLDCGTSGTLCQLNSLTINNSAYQIGYCWRASGQGLPLDGPNNPISSGQEYALQSLSVLTDPGSERKTSQIGFSNQPAIAYATSASVKQDENEINQNNFILDPRNGQLHLRQVTLDDGSNNFGLTNPHLQSWGTFPIQNLDAIVVHPSNAVLGVSYQYHKLMILNLPSAPVNDDQAPAALIISGYGVRQGLMNGPKAMAVAPDGRILILEADNQRIQAFDIKGNPVPCFVDTAPQVTVSTSDQGQSFAADLQAGTIPESLQVTLQNNYIPGIFLFPLDNSLTSSLISALNGGQFQTTNDPIITALSSNGVFLSYDPQNMNDHTVSSYITVNQPGQSWTITDPGQNLFYLITNQSNSLYVFHVISQYQVHAIESGQQWTLMDTYQAQTYRIQRHADQSGQFDVFAANSYFSLYNPNNETDIQYLDMAVESQGYIYVLSYVGNGSQTTDYRLDIYEPNGTFLLRVPDPSKTSTPQNVVAGRIALDIWRNLFTLNYETCPKPSGGPEPSISQWVPTPPLFSIPNAQTAQADFNSANVGNVKDDFLTWGNLKLNYESVSISTISSAGLWSVKDSASNANYQVVWAGDDLQVYSIPVA